MAIRLTVGGIDGNSGREYRVHFSAVSWVAFHSMPGDSVLYCGHVSSCAATDYCRSDEAREIAESFVGTLAGPDATLDTIVCDYCLNAPADGRVPAYKAHVCEACYEEHHGPVC